MDVLIGLAVLARSSGYCRPEIAEEPILDIREGRHPVLDRLQPSGQFVPNDVRLGVADRIFARVGASDELSKGQSTFMVEMTETARILNSATARSL